MVLAYTLQELLTVKSDDVQGRTRIYDQSSRVTTRSRLERRILQRADQGNAKLGLDVKVGSQAPPLWKRRVIFSFTTYFGEIMNDIPGVS